MKSFISDNYLKSCYFYRDSPVMEKQHGKDLHSQHRRGYLLTLLDHKHLNSIISFREGRNPVGAASSGDWEVEGSKVSSARPHSRSNTQARPAARQAGKEVK